MQKRPGNGLIIMGSESGCGKTALATGLAGTLQEEGFIIKVIKPIHIGTPASATAEIAFMSSITGTPTNYALQYIQEPGGLTEFGWREALAVCRSGTEPTLVELPGSAATPIARPEPSGRSWKDSAEFAADLKWPCLLVGKASPSGLERLLLNVLYCLSLKLTVAGMIQVQTSNTPAGDPARNLEELTAAIQERSRVPMLGILKYSPSINVGVNQGNLLKTTAAALDLLPIIRTLDLRISV